MALLAIDVSGDLMTYGFQNSTAYSPPTLDWHPVTQDWDYIMDPFVDVT